MTAGVVFENEVRGRLEKPEPGGSASFGRGDEFAALLTAYVFGPEKDGALEAPGVPAQGALLPAAGSGASEGLFPPDAPPGTGPGEPDFFRESLRGWASAVFLPAPGQPQPIQVTDAGGEAPVLLPGANSLPATFLPDQGVSGETAVTEESTLQGVLPFPVAAAPAGASAGGTAGLREQALPDGTFPDRNVPGPGREGADVVSENAVSSGGRGGGPDASPAGVTGSVASPGGYTAVGFWSGFAGGTAGSPAAAPKVPEGFAQVPAGQEVAPAGASAGGRAVLREQALPDGAVLDRNAPGTGGTGGADAFRADWFSVQSRGNLTDAVPERSGRPASGSLAPKPAGRGENILFIHSINGVLSASDLPGGAAPEPLEQLAAAVARFTAERQQSRTVLKVRLEPPHLGEVTVRLVLENNRLRVIFSVAEQAARELLADGLDRLQYQLQHQLQILNPRLEGVNVQIGGEDGGGFSTFLSGEPFSEGSGRYGHGSSGREPPASATAGTAGFGPERPTGRAGLNLLV